MAVKGSRIRFLDEFEVRGRRVLVRVDLNVPMRDGRVGDATRLERILPTVEDLAARGARIVLLSHFGRPKGRRDPALSLRPIADALAGFLNGRSVAFAEDCVGATAESAVAQLTDGDVVLLENLRFHAGEEANDGSFADALARLGDLYVDDAFSCAHRAHASVEALARRLPAAAGLAMQAELEALHRALDEPQRPVMAIIGGAKVSTKLAVLEHLCTKVDAMAIGGGMANTFLLARGHDVGRSLCEPDLVATARGIDASAAKAGCQLILPFDVVTAAELAPGAQALTVASGEVDAAHMILDIGPESAAALATELKSYRTLVWNGPLGCFETPPFDGATNTVAAAAAELTRGGALLSVAGGGDTLAALYHAGAAADFTYLSAAGGAFLEWIEGRALPGVEALAGADPCHPGLDNMVLR